MSDIYFNPDFTLFHEKYRPIRIDDIILPVNLKKKFKTIIKNNDIPNMLFFSNEPGVGKTTTAKALVEECDVDYLYINTSLQRGIDVLRSTIARYAESMTWEGKNKVVILDEFDGATPELQNALKASIEEYHDVCRFICTCNSINKIIQPLQSRLDPVDFNFNSLAIKKDIMPQIGKHLIEILENENIKYDSPQTIQDLMNKCYPDIRTMIKSLRDCYEQYGIVNKDIFKILNLNNEFYEMIINKKITKARRHLIDNNIDYSEIYTLIKKNMLDDKMITNGDIRMQLYSILNEYDYRHAFVNDHELNFTACLFEMIKIL